MSNLSVVNPKQEEILTSVRVLTIKDAHFNVSMHRPFAAIICARLQCLIMCPNIGSLRAKLKLHYRHNIPNNASSNTEDACTNFTSISLSVPTPTSVSLTCDPNVK
ncbi:hypothetical protein RJT34_12511 [Clitoria ternatea]|uniref:Uncharacterized protein n=1 Tax=Clitoria ternatea TaxID=43366 RepID=A0AAN9PKK1_CLITE